MQDDTKQRKQVWDTRFLVLAKHIASWSKDPSTQVGCVIVREDKVIIGMGFNGFPQGSLDDQKILIDKDKKRLRTVHAEMNALHFSTEKITGATVYVTHHPCAHCTANLLQHHPKRIVIPDEGSQLGSDWDKSVQEAAEMFAEQGINVDRIRINE